jgi:cysteine desulfurase
MQKLGVDLFSLNASKVYGPKQVGVLFLRSNVKLEPIVYGGGQEQNLRSGTENVAGAVGLAKALELAQQEKTEESPRLVKLRNAFAEKALKLIPNSFLNGPELQSAFRRRGVRVKSGRVEPGQGVAERLPNNLNFTFKGAEGEAVMLYLDALNIAVSTGSACASETGDPSHVLKAIGLTGRDARDSIRITLGRSTTKQELDFVLKALPRVVKMVRGM